MNYASVVQRLFGRVPTNLSLVSIVEADTPESAAIEESRRHLADFSDAPHAVARVGDRFVAVGRTHAVMLNSTSTDIARIPEEEQEKDPPATVRELTPVEKKNAREHVKRGRKEFRFGRFKPGMAVTWNGERWIVYDARARGGSRFTLMLVSPDYEKLADEVQPADLGETESTVIEAGNLPASFTPAHLDQLRKQFASVERIDPSGPSYDKMLKLLDGMSQQQLKQVAGAGIKFLSKLALNRVKRTEAVGEARVRRVLWSTKVGNDTWGAAVLGPHFFATLNGEDYDFEDGEVYGLVAPKKVPPAVAARLEKSRLDFEGDKQTARESVQEARFQHGDRVRIHYKNPRTDIEKAFQGKVGSISGEERDGSTRMFRVKFNPPVQVPGVDPVTSDLWTAEFLKPAGAAETVMVRHGTLAAFVAANAPRLASLPGEGTAFQKLWLGEFGALSESTGMSRWTHFGQQLSESFQAFDRYDALGIPRPDPATMCKGPCEGTGVVPISRDETDPELRRRWDVAEQENPADDGWHFVVCPACEGSRLSEEGAWRTTKSGHRIFIDGGKVTKGNPHVLKAAGGQDSSAGASGETDQAKSHASKHGLKMVAAPKGKAAVGSKLPYASDGTIVAGYAVNAKGQRFALTQGPDGKIGMLTAGKHKESVDEAEPGDGMRFGAAKLVGGEKAVPFSALKVGAKFHFPKSSTTYTKTSEAGKYAAADGRKFKTGTHAAVIPESLDEAKVVPAIDSSTYREVAKLPKYNAKVSPLSAHGSDGGKLLAKRLPGWTRADHTAAAIHHEEKAQEMQADHSRLLDVAARETWGRDFEPTDYKISGIGSDEFSAKHKDELRRLAHTSSAHKDAAHAHRAAAKMRSLAKEDLDEAKVVWSAAVPAKAQKKGYVPDPTLGQAGMNERCRHCYYAESVDGPDGKQVRCLMFRFLAASAGHCDEWERRGSPRAKKVSIPREGVDEGYQHVHFEGSKSARAKVVMSGGKTKSVQGRTFDDMLLVHPTGNYQWGVTHIPTGLGLVPPPGFADDREAVRFAKAASALGGWDFTDPTAVPPELSQKMGTLVASFRSSIRRTGGGSYESVDDLDEARAFKLSTKDPATMTPAEINREKDKLSAASSELTDKFIEMGRGHWKQSDIRAEAEKGDELSKQSVAISDRQQDLSIEIELRYGPNAPTRLPLRKGFGPRKKATDESVDEMAKLSANGANELMRASKESVVTDDESIDWRRVTRAWMSDGRVLEKRDVNFKATGAADYQKARKHSYGWKVLGRFKPGLLKDNEKLAAAMTKTRANLEAEGWSIESFTMPQ